MKSVMVSMPTKACLELSHSGAARRPLATNAKNAFLTWVTDKWGRGGRGKEREVKKLWEGRKKMDNMGGGGGENDQRDEEKNKKKKKKPNQKQHKTTTKTT